MSFFEFTLLAWLVLATMAAVALVMWVGIVVRELWQFAAGRLVGVHSPRTHALPLETVRVVEVRGAAWNTEVRNGWVTHRSYGHTIGIGSEPYLWLVLDNGETFGAPKRLFTTAPDGVLEYRW